MTTLGLDHYNLSAPRELLERLRAFYTEAIGLSAGYRPPFDGFGYWLYAGEHAVLHLSESVGEGETAGPTGATFNHAAFTCSGREEVERRLTGLGIDYNVARIPELGVTQLFLSDPAGNGVELNFPDE